MTSLYTTFPQKGSRPRGMLTSIPPSMKTGKQKPYKFATSWYTTHTSYNMFLGSLSLNSLGVILFTLHLAMKFRSSSGDIFIMHDDKKEGRECYMANLNLMYTPMTTHIMEKEWEGGMTLTKEDLDPRVNDEARIKSIGRRGSSPSPNVTISFK